jgi:hypothetical protein
MYIYQTKINKHKNSNGSYSFFDFVKKMSYYFRYNEQILFIIINTYLEYLHFYMYICIIQRVF